ncbi:hypothetical protein [Tolypothrix sp. VBCCA 56010]
MERLYDCRDVPHRTSVRKLKVRSPMPNAQCPMPNAQCPIPHAQ